jgi:hypothetical protein
MDDLLQNGYFKMWYEDEILVVDFIQEHYNYEMLDATIKKRLEITKDKKVLMLSDISKIKSFSLRARQRLFQKDTATGCVAVAAIVKTKTQEVLFNFTTSIYKPQVPTKMFRDKEKARQWLLSFKRKIHGC